MQIDVDGNEFDDDQSLVQKDPDQEDYDQDNSDPMSTLYEWDISCCMQIFII